MKPITHMSDTQSQLHSYVLVEEFRKNDKKQTGRIVYVNMLGQQVGIWKEVTNCEKMCDKNTKNLKYEKNDKKQMEKREPQAFTHLRVEKGNYHA